MKNIYRKCKQERHSEKVTVENFREKEERSLGKFELKRKKQSSTYQENLSKWMEKESLREIKKNL